LEYLGLDNFSQDFLNGIDKLKKLKELSINMATIDDVSPLLHLPDLIYIDFSYIPDDKISLIAPLATSNSLKNIIINFGSPKESRYFWNNWGEVFVQNGIKIHEPSDYR
jgi:hypothetical protein